MSSLLVHIDVHVHRVNNRSLMLTYISLVSAMHIRRVMKGWKDVGVERLFLIAIYTHNWIVGCLSGIESASLV